MGFEEVSREHFFSMLDVNRGKVVCLPSYAGCTYYVLDDLNALETKAVMFGVRIDKRNLKLLIEKEYYRVNKKFLQGEKEWKNCM